MKTALKIVFSASLLGLIFWEVGGIRVVVDQILRIDPLYLIPILGLKSLDRGLMPYKWGLLLRARGIDLPFLRGMLIYSASSFWGMLLPTTLGSDTVRAYCTSRDGIDPREVVASIIIERLLGFFSAILLASVSLLLLTRFGHLGDYVLVAWILMGSLLLAGIALFAFSVNARAFHLVHDRILRNFHHYRFARKLREFHETYRSFSVDRKSLIAFFGLTLGEQVLPIFEFWLIALGMGIEVGLISFVLVMPLAMLFARLPISIDGIGILEGIFIVLMALDGMSDAQAFAIAIAGRILLTITLFPWWLAFMITTGNFHAPGEPPKEESRNGAS